MSRTAYYYKPKLSDDSEIIDVLNELTDKHNRWGFPKCFKRIRKLGYSWNHKRVREYPEFCVTTIQKYLISPTTY